MTYGYDSAGFDNHDVHRETSTPIGARSVTSVLAPWGGRPVLSLADVD
jgi:hypothetical protein